MANDQYYLRHPSKQTFFRLLAVVMGILCLNSQYWGWYKLPKNKLFRLQRIMVLIFAPISCVSEIIHLTVNYSSYDFSEIAVIMSITPIGLAMLSKILIAQTPSYKKVMTSFMRDIHLNNIYVKNNPEHRKDFLKPVMKNAEKYTRFTLAMIGCFFYFCYTSWMVVPIIHNIERIESIHNITTRLQLTMYLWTPYIDYEYNFYAYLFMNVLGVYCGFVVTTVMMAFDTVNLALVYHLTGHIHLLKYDLANDKNEILTDDEWANKLKHYTTTYYFITSNLDDVQSAFGLNVLIIYAQNLFQGGLLLYQLLSIKDTEVILTYGLMIPSFMGMLLLMSVALENLRIQADDIPSLIYDLPWESMSVRNQKVLRSVLFQVQPTLEFIAAFNLKTGVQPAINIVKTTFSYYVMIKSSKEDEPET